MKGATDIRGDFDEIIKSLDAKAELDGNGSRRIYGAAMSWEYFSLIPREIQDELIRDAARHGYESLFDHPICHEKRCVLFRKKGMNENDRDRV